MDTTLGKRAGVGKSSRELDVWTVMRGKSAKPSSPLIRREPLCKQGYFRSLGSVKKKECNDTEVVLEQNSFSS